MSGGFIPASYIDLRDYLASGAASFEAIGAALAGGHLQAFEWHDGRLSVLSPSMWAGPNGRQILKDGCMVGLRVGGEVRTFRPIVIRRPKPRVVRPELSVVASAAARPGGRPLKWDWEGAMVELSRLDADDGTENKTSADLARHLSAWFVQQTGDTPADSEIRKRVKRFREALKT